MVEKVHSDGSHRWTEQTTIKAKVKTRRTTMGGRESTLQETGRTTRNTGVARERRWYDLNENGGGSSQGGRT